MIRAVVSAFIGYVVTAICVTAGIAVAWSCLGSEFAFAGETRNASTGWSFVILYCGLGAAVAGGWVAARIGGRKGRLAVRVLMGLIIVFGSLTFLAQLDAQPPPLPTGLVIRDLTFMEAEQYAVSPIWYNAAIVVVGGFGTWLGGRVRLPWPTRKADPSPTAE